MTITIGRGKRRQQVSFPTGAKAGWKDQHIADVLTVMRQAGVRFVGDAVV